MRVLIRISCLLFTANALVYKEDVDRRLVFHEDLQTQCEHVNYDFNPILQNIYRSSAEVQNFAQFMDLKSFALEAHEHVEREIRFAVGNFCVILDYGDDWFKQQYGKSVFGSNEGFEAVVDPIFQKYHLNSSDANPKAALGKLYGAFLYTAYFLKTIRRQDGIVGFDEEKFAANNPDLNILNYTYSDFTCKPESLQIRAKACIVTVPNDKLYLLYTRQEKTIDEYGWFMSYKVTYSHKTLLENAIDKKPKFMVKSNDTLMFVSDVNCTSSSFDDEHGFFDYKARNMFMRPEVTLCHRKYIAATTSFNPDQNCRITSGGKRTYYEQWVSREYPVVTLNCTLNDGNTTFAEVQRWSPTEFQRRLNGKTAIHELGLKKSKEITKWEHKQQFKNGNEKTLLDFNLNDFDGKTELKHSEGSESNGTIWNALVLIILLISLVTNVALVLKYSNNPCIEHYIACFKNKAVSLVRIRAMNFENQNFENPEDSEDQLEEQSRQ